MGGLNATMTLSTSAESKASSTARCTDRTSLSSGTVSYTHLDVYKRQGLDIEHGGARLATEVAHPAIEVGFGGEVDAVLERDVDHAVIGRDIEGHPGRQRPCLLYTSRCV